MDSAGKTIKPTADLLEMIVVAMDSNNFESGWYLDVADGEVVPYQEGADDDALIELIESDTEGERFIPVPTRSSRQGWEQMEQFIQTLDDNNAQMVLHTAINGPGAFRRFKDAVYELGISETWFDFKNRMDARAALDWLHECGLIREQDMDTGLREYDELQAKRGQWQENLNAMIPGQRIRCSYNGGHEGQLTPGKTYEVLAERNANLLVQVKDDREKKVWLPKSNFELA